MAKFMIRCFEATDRWLIVEAPTKLAAEKFYDTTHGDEFNEGHTEWNLDRIEALVASNGAYLNEKQVDYVVTEDGKIMSND